MTNHDVRNVTEIRCRYCFKVRRDFIGTVNQAIEYARDDGWEIIVDARGDYFVKCPKHATKPITKQECK